MAMNQSVTLDQARRREFVVLLVISGGLIAILLSIIAGLFLAKGSAALPNWAENVLVSIATASVLKLGDCLSTLTQLASGRQIGQLGERLGNSVPAKAPAPKDAEDAAQVTADAAQEQADEIKGQ
jgi:hypothetical protein